MASLFHLLVDEGKALHHQTTGSSTCSSRNHVDGDCVLCCLVCLVLLVLYCSRSTSSIVSLLGDTMG